MSSQRVPETRRPYGERQALPAITQFFCEARTGIQPGDVPLLQEWSDWATRYGSLDEVWHASRNPELMIFLLGHATRRGYLDEGTAVHNGLERFVTWCVNYAGLDPDGFGGHETTHSQSPLEWFSVSGPSVFSRARRAARRAERAIARGDGAALARALLRERTVQAAILRLVIDSPFFEVRPLDEAVPNTACEAETEIAHTEEAGPGMPAVDDDEANYGPALVLAPADRGPWGIVTYLTGPSDPPGATGTGARALRDADQSLRHGMILLTKQPAGDYLATAEECFRDALSLLLSGVGHEHPKMAYACDRIALVCQIQGRDEEAEDMYLRAIALRDAGAWDHSLWDEVTLMNLATLYEDQGKYVLRDVMLDRLEKERRDAKPGSEDESRDSDQLEL